MLGLGIGARLSVRGGKGTEGGGRLVGEVGGIVVGHSGWLVRWVVVVWVGSGWVS